MFVFVTQANKKFQKNFGPFKCVTGIQMLASGNNYPNAIIAPYAAFPLILHWRSRAFGVAWYAAMLQGALMQGQLGATENTKIAGFSSFVFFIAPFRAFREQCSDVNCHYRSIFTTNLVPL